MLFVIFCGLLIAVGIVGVAVPLLPGSLLVAAAVLLWAIVTGGQAAWTTFGIATALVVVGWLVKYLVPGRRLKARGIPNRTLLLGAVLGIVGFFVIPVIGLPIGFVTGVYVGERVRLGKAQAWPATRSALGAVGLAILIEFTFAFLAAATWVIGVVVTR